MLGVGSDRQFQALSLLLGLDLFEDERFRTNQMRVKHREELNLILAEQFQHFTRDQLLEKLSAAKIPAGPVNSMDQVFKHEEAEQALIEENNSTLRGVRSIAFEVEGVNLQRSLQPPPTVNQDGSNILMNDLGLSESEVDALYQ